jgi:hypothetical protein
VRSKDPLKGLVPSKNSLYLTHMVCVDVTDKSICQYISTIDHSLCMWPMQGSLAWWLSAILSDVWLGFGETEEEGGAERPAERENT